MYQLGEQFQLQQADGIANNKAVLKGTKYRITVLSDILVRLEYSENGTFEDRPTTFAWKRNFPSPQYQVKESSTHLEITTSHFKLTYKKEAPFLGSAMNPTSNLKIELVGTDRTWYFHHPEVRNFGAPGMGFDLETSKNKFRKGLFSPDGFASVDDSNSLAIDAGGDLVARNPETDLYVFLYHNDFTTCLKDYYQLTGSPALLPRYAFGNWWSRNITYNDKSLKELVDTFREKEIPLSVLVLNEDWHLKKEIKKKEIHSGFTFNKNLFAAPYNMIQYLHSKGIRLGLNVNPEQGIFDTEEYYQKALTYLPADEHGVIPFDVYNPKFIDVYLKLFVHPLDALGIDFYWIDYQNKEAWNKLWVLDHYHFNDMKRDYKRRPMILTRNPLVAAHRYPVLYSGQTIVSWETLKQIPFYNSSATNIGVNYWSHDIGGFHKGIEDNELYTRFVQLGAFSPILKFGSEKGKYYKREPWKWSVKTYKIVKDYLELRHRMIPYLYAEGYKYHKYGMPLLQPIFYKYPEMYDDNNYRNEYYLGTELFVCPIISKKDYDMNRVIHKFYMPDGIWYDFFTGKKFPGGKNYVSFFKDQDYPVFAKTGAIIPFGNQDDLNDTTPPKNMEIHIFPGKDNQYNLYEDDGVSDLYRKGYYLLTSIEYNYLPNNYTVIIRSVEGKSGIIPERRNYKIRFRNTKQANDVIVYFNDQKIQYSAYVEGPDFIVEVENIPTIGQLTFNCKGNDIEIDAVRLINEDIAEIISDLQIETDMKERIDAILFGDLPIKKKRIAVRKLGKHGLEKRHIKLFLKLLEYVSEV